MKLVRAGPEAGIYNRSHGIAVFGRRVRRNELKFLDRIYIRGVGNTVIFCFIRVHAIDNIVIGLRPITIHQGLTAAATSLSKSTYVVVHNTRSEQRELSEIAAVQRQVDGGVAGDQSSQLCTFGLQYTGGTRDLDSFRYSANFKIEIHATHLTHFKGETTGCNALKSGRLYSQRIVAWRHRWEG